MEKKFYTCKIFLTLFSLLFCISLYVRIDAQESNKNIEKIETEETDGQKAKEDEKDKNVDESSFADEIIIRGKRDTVIENKKKETFNERTISKKGIELLAGASQSNPLKALQVLPSVNVQGSDSTGLDRGQSINIRGKTSYHLNRNIESLPITGGHAFGSMGDIIDLENIESITLFSGAVPANKGFGFSNAGGVVDMSMLKPIGKSTITAKQAAGMNKFTKSFLRLDSDKMPWGTSVFISGSYAGEDKWRGSGSKKRVNLECGITQKITEHFNMEVFGVWMKSEGNNYRSLNIDQVNDLSNNYDYDYNEELTGDKSKDIYYYDNNRYKYIEKSIFGKAELNILKNGKIILKPYFLREDGLSISGTAKLKNVRTECLNQPGLTYWDQEHDTYGGVLSYDQTYKDHKFSIGYWYQSMESPPPPTTQKAYMLNNDGSLTYAGWSTFVKYKNMRTDSPFVNWEGNIGEFSLNAGLRYLMYKEPTFTYYDGSTMPDVAYEDVFDYNPSVKSNMKINGKTYRELLPNAGISYSLNNDAVVRANYGRGYGRQNWGSIPNTYFGKEEIFTNAGISYQDLWRKLRPEVVDNYDMGLRYKKEKWYAEPSVFYAYYRYKQAKIYDSKLDVSYFESSQKAHSYGAELSIGGSPVKALNIFSSGAYNHYTYAKDLTTTSSTTIHAKGNKVPDCPQWSANLGAGYTIWGISISPIARYIGKRYGNIENTESVPAYFLADLNIAYKKDTLFGINDFSAGITITNLFNKKYISSISWSEYNYDNNGSYSPGAPLSIIFSISGKL